MKKLFLFIASVVLFQVHGSAASCQTETLDKYIALGSTGCVLGNLTVSNFAYHAKSSGGAPEITAKEITVTPLLPPVGTFGLQFSAPWDVNSGQDQFSGITYHVAAASANLPIQELRLDGNGFKDGLFGSVVVTEAIGGATTQSLQIYEKCDEVCTSKTSATLNLMPAATSLAVSDAVALESRLGTAALASFVDWFVICIPCV